jgi:hypothetical protein
MLVLAFLFVGLRLVARIRGDSALERGAVQGGAAQPEPQRT